MVIFTFCLSIILLYLFRCIIRAVKYSFISLDILLKIDLFEHVEFSSNQIRYLVIRFLDQNSNKYIFGLAPIIYSDIIQKIIDQLELK